MPLTTITARSTNTRDVVLAVQRLLVAQLADIFPEEAIMVSDPDSWDGDNTPEAMMSTSFITICPGDSTFPDDVQYGGGLQTIEEKATLELYIFSDSRLDSSSRMPAAVYDENEGLFELKRRVLRALVMQDPTGDNQLPLLSELLPVYSSTKPRKNASGVHFIKLVFGVPFFWDLS